MSFPTKKVTIFLLFKSQKNWRFNMKSDFKFKGVGRVCQTFLIFMYFYVLIEVKHEVKVRKNKKKSDELVRRLWIRTRISCWIVNSFGIWTTRILRLFLVGKLMITYDMYFPPCCHIVTQQAYCREFWSKSKGRKQPCMYGLWLL